MNKMFLILVVFMIPSIVFAEGLGGGLPGYTSPSLGGGLPGQYGQQSYYSQNRARYNTQNNNYSNSLNNTQRNYNYGYKQSYGVRSQFNLRQKY